jgi:hypothetical protein
VGTKKLWGDKNQRAQARAARGNVWTVVLSSCAPPRCDLSDSQVHLLLVGLGHVTGRERANRQVRAMMRWAG